MTRPSDQTARRPRIAGVLAWYLGAALLARTADEGARVALVVLAMDRTGSVAIGGTLVAVLLIPHVIAAPLVGGLLDRSRRPGIVLAAAVSLFAIGLASAAVALGTGPLWLAYLGLAVAGCGGPAITGGLTSRLADLVPDQRRPRAYGLDSTFYNVASMAGPAVVAAVATTWGSIPATMVLAAFALLGALGILILRLKASPTQRASTNRLLGGARAVLSAPELRELTWTTSLGQLGPGALAVVATALAANADRSEIAGLLLTAVAAGSLLGSLLWAWHPLPADIAPIVTSWSMIGIGLPLAAAALLHLQTTALWLTAVCFGLSGLFIGPFAAALFLARNQLAPTEVRAQVFTIGAGLKVTASAAGAALIGLAAHQPVSTQLLLVAASPLAAGILGTALFRRTRARGSNEPTHPNQAATTAD